MPSLPETRAKTVLGIIGFGDMGRLYARSFSSYGFNHIYACDLPSKYDDLKKEWDGKGVAICQDGYEICRRCDFVLYCVEASSINQVVKKYGFYCLTQALQ